MTTAIVCGGRYYGRVPFGSPAGAAEIEKATKERFMMRETLDHIRSARRIVKVIDGGADGADQVAHEWAISRTIVTVRVRAEWKRYGRRAGPIRNGRMLEMKPDLVIAFPGGAGTADMVRQAIAAGVEVLDFRT